MSENRLLDALTCRGVFVSASVRYWGARKKLSASDMGPSLMGTGKLNAGVLVRPLQYQR